MLLMPGRPAPARSEQGPVWSGLPTLPLIGAEPHSPDILEQLKHRPPLDVVAHVVPKDL